MWNQFDSHLRPVLQPPTTLSIGLVHGKQNLPVQGGQSNGLMKMRLLQCNNGRKSEYESSYGTASGASLQPPHPKKSTGQEERRGATVLWLGLMSKDHTC